jgi:hypothetical protein
MAAIALTIIILLNYLAFYYAYGAIEGSVGTKKKRFFPAKNPVDVRREVVGSTIVASELRVSPAPKERSYAEHQYVFYLREITAKFYYCSYVKKH